MAGHRDTVLTVRCSPDGSTLVVSGGDGRVALWDGDARALLGSVLASGERRHRRGHAPRRLRVEG